MDATFSRNGTRDSLSSASQKSREHAIEEERRLNTRVGERNTGRWAPFQGKIPRHEARGGELSWPAAKFKVRSTLTPLAKGRFRWVTRVTRFRGRIGCPTDSLTSRIAANEAPQPLLRLCVVTHVRACACVRVHGLLLDQVSSSIRRVAVKKIVRG